MGEGAGKMKLESDGFEMDREVRRRRRRGRHKESSGGGGRRGSGRAMRKDSGTKRSGHPAQFVRAPFPGRARRVLRSATARVPLLWF